MHNPNKNKTISKIIIKEFIPSIFIISCSLSRLALSQVINPSGTILTNTTIGYTATSIDNQGTININSGGPAIISSSPNSSITNNGTININAPNTAGIVSSGAGAIINNSGNITVGTNVNNSNGIKIRATGATINNSGKIDEDADSSIIVETNQPSSIFSLNNSSLGSIGGIHFQAAGGIRAEINNSGYIGKIWNQTVTDASMLSSLFINNSQTGTIGVQIDTSNGLINYVKLENYGLVNSYVVGNNLEIKNYKSGIIIKDDNYVLDTPYLTLDNLGKISGYYNSVYIENAVDPINNPHNFSIGSNSIIFNSGLIQTTFDSRNAIASPDYGTGIYVSPNAAPVTITNTGSIIANVFGIKNDGVIDVLNNAQGFGSKFTPNGGVSSASGALTYTGNLPANYNIIINSTYSYGRMAVTNGVGITTFGIYTGSTLNTHRYTAVLSGINNSNLNALSLSGSYGSATWTLAPEAADCSINCIYDLVVLGAGPSGDDTQKSIVKTAAVLENTFALQNSVLTNSFSHDCNTFGANNVCVSAGGRNTGISSANGLGSTSTQLIAAYRPHPNYRVGAYADQNLSANKGDSTVVLGNKSPLIGMFGIWSDRLDGTGTEVKFAAAYGQKKTTMTRPVVGDNEAGTGNSQLNSQGAQLTVKHGFPVGEQAIVSPYAGIRYTQNNMAGYTEAASDAVTAPLSYTALKTKATTALAGVGASYKVMPEMTAVAAVGVESDTRSAIGSYDGTNSSISGLTPVSLNANPVKTRLTTTLGASYSVAKNQLISIVGVHKKEQYQAVSTTTFMATYTVGL